MDFEKNISTSNINRSVSSLSGTSQQSSAESISNVPIIRKVILTEQQKQEMLLLGLDPTNTDQVNSYLTMNPEDVKNRLDGLMAQNETQSTQNTENSLLQNNSTQIEKHEVHDQKHVHSEESEHHEAEHSHNFNIDFNSEEWKSLDARGKMLYFAEQGAKAEYTEDEWQALSNEEKVESMDNFLDKEFSVHHQNWENACDIKKLEILSDFLNDNRIAAANTLSAEELMGIKINFPEEYKNLCDRFFENNEKIDLKQEFFDTFKREQDIILKHYEEAKSNFLKSKNLPDDFFENNPNLLVEFNQQYSKSKGNKKLPRKALVDQYKAVLDGFLNQKGITKEQYDNELALQIEYYEFYTKQHGIEQTPKHVQDNIKVIEELKELNGGSLEGIATGNVTLEQLFEKQGINIGEEGLNDIDFRNPDNIKALDELFRAYLKLDKNAIGKDILNAICAAGFDAQTLNTALQVFNSSHNPDRIKLRDIHQHGKVSLASALLLGKDSKSDEDQKYVVTTLVSAQYRKIKARGGSFDALNSYVTYVASHYEKDNAAALTLTGAELNDKNMVSAANQGISKREDALGVFAIINQLFNDSENISEEMKQFYAQNSIESLQTPEQRAAQVSDLRSYKNESFNAGMETGSANVTRRETSTVNQNNNSETVSQQSFDSKLTLSEPAQQVYDSIDEMLQGNIDIEEIKAKFAELEPNEQIELLKKYVEIKGDRINVKLCNNFPELVGILVDKGKGLEIVEKCDMPTGDKAIKLLPLKDKKRLAIDNPYRLAKGTYQTLVDNGDVQVSKFNKPYSALT